MTNYYRMSPSRNSSRRSGRQNFRNKNISPRRSAIRKNSSSRYGRQNFSNKRVSPRRSARRSPNRRSGKQNFRNKRVGKERFINLDRDKIVIIPSIIGLLIVIGLFVWMAIDSRRNRVVNSHNSLISGEELPF